MKLTITIELTRTPKPQPPPPTGPSTHLGAVTSTAAPPRRRGIGFDTTATGATP